MEAVLRTMRRHSSSLAMPSLFFANRCAAAMPIGVAALPRPKKWRIVLRFVADIAFFVAFAGLCVFVASWLCLPSFREYYYLGFALGLLLYLKTFHKAVAFFKKMCYNVVRKLVNCLKKRKNFRKKEEKCV